MWLVEMSEVSLRERFVAAGAALRGLPLLWDGGASFVWGGCRHAFAVVFPRCTCGLAEFQGADATTARRNKLAAVGWKKPGVEKVGEALLIGGAPAEKRLGGPAQHQGVQYTDLAGGLDEEGGVIDANGKAVFAQEGDEAG
jgi:hypothetical protein